jgi:hypothetical protein
MVRIHSTCLMTMVNLSIIFYVLLTKSYKNINSAFYAVNHVGSADDVQDYEKREVIDCSK